MMKAAETQKDHQRLLNNLRLIQKINTVAELSELLGISKATWTNRMKEPWRLFSYDDLRLIAKYCNVDFITIVDGTLNLKGEQ